MKLVFEADTREEAAVIRAMLEANGIPAALSGEFTFGVLSIGIPKVIGVWVYLDHQADEANNLIQNPEYEVVEPVDVEEFYRLSESGDVRQSALSQMLKGTALALVALLLFIWMLAIMLR